MAPSKLGFGVVGCGRMGRRRMRSVVEHPKTDLLCVADVNPADARSAAEEFACPAYSRYQDLLQHDHVDIVIVSVPNKWHQETVVAALEAKKHVFCEKPLAKTPDEAQAMVDAARRNGVTLKTGSNLRFFPNVLKARELLDANTIGDLLFIRTWIGHDGWNLRDNWYANPEIAGGGTFLDNGCHVLDLCRWFLGEVTSAFGVVSTKLWPVQPLEDNGFGIFETADGKTAFVHASWTEWAGYMYMEIYGTAGFIRIDSRGRACTTVLGRRDGSEQVFDFSALPANSYAAEFAHWIGALEAGREPSPSGYDGLRAVAMAHAVYQSSRTGCKVSV